MDEVLLFKSLKYRPKIAFRGHCYRWVRKNVGTIHWRCERKGCNGSIVTPVQIKSLTAPQIEIMKPHCHDPNLDRMNEIRATKEIKLEFPEEITPTHERPIDVNNGSDSHPDLRINGVEVLQGNSDSFVVADDINSTFFCVREDGIFVFEPEDMITILKQAQTWVFDARLRLPQCFSHRLLTVHALSGTLLTPCIYALLPDLQEKTIKGFLIKLNNKYSFVGPKFAIINYDEECRKAVSAIYPNTAIEYCFQDLSEVIRGYVDQRNDDVTKKYLLRLCGLAFLPAEGVVDAFEETYEKMEIQEADKIPPHIIHMFHRFEDDFIGRPRAKRGRLDPQFAINMWNTRRSLEGTIVVGSALQWWRNDMKSKLNVGTCFQLEETFRKDKELQVYVYNRFCQNDQFKQASDNVEQLVKTFELGQITTDDLLEQIAKCIGD